MFNYILLNKYTCFLYKNTLQFVNIYCNEIMLNIILFIFSG